MTTTTLGPTTKRVKRSYQDVSVSETDSDSGQEGLVEHGWSLLLGALQGLPPSERATKLRKLFDASLHDGERYRTCLCY
jgi:hypothetical protein